MLLTLLLDFGSSGGSGLAPIAWALAFIAWLPQLLVGWLVLRKSEAGQRPLLAQLLLLLAPLGLLVTTGIKALVWLVFLYAYSTMQWELWLLVLLLPTCGAMLMAIARHKPLPKPPRAASTRPAQPQWVRWLAFAGVGITLAAVATQLYRPSDQSGSVIEAQPWRRAERAAKVREDSLRFIEQYAERPPRTW